MQAHCPPETYFAPAARQPADAIALEVETLGDLGSLASILDAMPDFVMLLNRERQILFGNRGLRAYATARGLIPLEGLRPGEVLECRQVKSAPSGCGTDEACRTCGAVQSILAGLAGHSTRLECRLITQTHDALDLSVYASPFKWNGGDYVLMIATDVSDRRRREMLERVFFHDVMNTALGIQGLSEILETDVGSANTIAPLLRHSSDALVGEIKSQQLLLAAETRELRVAPIALTAGPQLEAVADLYRHARVAAEKHIALELPGGDFGLVADPAILQRVLGNLLKNALEASQAGDTIAFGARAEAGTARFWCHNPGVIPRDAQLQIFRRNFTTKGPGRGIGTFGARLLTERYLGGQLTFTTGSESGTTFTVSLPR